MIWPARCFAPVPRPWRPHVPAAPPPASSLRRLRQVRLTDGVGHTLFEEYAGHRANRGEVETGWVLLGLREADEAIVVATLPAGAEADAGVAHVRFNSEAQVVASRIVRQSDRRLRILGVVHTHPGSLRHPSEGICAATGNGSGNCAAAKASSASAPPTRCGRAH